ncbi:MAG: hypothetical protein WCC84_00570 [Candidatus Cybelea sp.]
MFDVIALGKELRPATERLDLEQPLAALDASGIGVAEKTMTG